jgi:hypothetical protein
MTSGRSAIRSGGGSGSGMTGRSSRRAVLCRLISGRSSVIVHHQAMVVAPAIPAVSAQAAGMLGAKVSPPTVRGIRGLTGRLRSSPARRQSTGPRLRRQLTESCNALSAPLAAAQPFKMQSLLTTRPHVP